MRLCLLFKTQPMVIGQRRSWLVLAAACLAAGGRGGPRRARNMVPGLARLASLPVCGGDWGPWKERRESACSFGNGVRIFAADATETQLDRYAAPPHLHEPAEERLFASLLFGAPAGSAFVDVGAAIARRPRTSLASPPTHTHTQRPPRATTASSRRGSGPSWTRTR